ncbi:MAG TPA: P-loop NTPase [Methanomassiliicoccales archaeon]|jgi:nitrogenase iron protein NifH
MRQIAIYGKGGIGKSTISANLAAGFAERGLNTWYVGCDPKADGSMTLLGGRKIPTFLEQKKEGGKDEDYSVADGFKGVKCVEIGGPLAGVGCAGRGIIVAVHALYKEFFDDRIDIIIYDVPGDVVCGGFAAPLREGFANEVFIVTSGEYLSLYAANNICRGLNNLGVDLGGMVCNSREVDDEESSVSEFAERIGSKLVGFVPRDRVVRDCENLGRTVIEGAPDSEQAKRFRRLGERILENKKKNIPSPMAPEDIRELLRKRTGST